MPTYDGQAQVTDIARFLLERRKHMHHSAILFLGARTGGLFRSKPFYEVCEKVGRCTFDGMSREEQFAQCYRGLSRENFSRDDLEEMIALVSLDNLPTSDGDRALAALVKAGFFDVIISTNIDKTLERAFVDAAMEAGRDFHVILPQRDFIGDLPRLEKNSSCLLIKVFGDVDLEKYQLLQRESYIENHEGLKSYLLSRFEQDLLIVGYDPFWDRALGNIFPGTGQAFWYAHEDAQEQNPFTQALQQRKGKYTPGSYDQFMPLLHWHTQSGSPQAPFSSTAPSATSTSVQATSTARPHRKRTPRQQSLRPDKTPEPGSNHAIQDTQPEMVTPPPQNHAKTTERSARRKICIFHYQDDQRYLDELKPYLTQIERKEYTDIWDESRIAVGSRWEEEIQKALNDAMIAILFVSAPFMASDFVETNVLIPLLKSANEEGATIISIIVGHFDFEATSLAQFQTLNDVSRPLRGMKRNDRERLWTKLLRTLKNRME